jgi:Flp pilus assembly pilin Flp
MGKFARRLLHDTRGATAVEYALILALILLAMTGPLKAVTAELIDMLDYASEKVTI